MDYYATLGVSKDATPDQLKKAYRKLASTHHPDKGGDTKKFQEIQTAYDTLSDPQKRQMYDNPRPQMQGMPGGFSFHSQGFDLNDLFAQAFGGSSPFGQRNSKPTYRTRMNVSLLDAYNGNRQYINVQTNTHTTPLSIDVPKGIISGQQIRYDNLLDNATLLVEFIVLPDLKFERHDNNLVCSHNVSVFDLITGSSFEFTTISGKTLNVNIKPGTQPHTHLKLTGFGMPILNTPLYGDQIILLKPYIPDNIDTQLLDAINRLK